ncbi:hypothetical protein ACIPUB_16620 [Paeniglutamicibacter sp. ORCA_105]|uniref:hypothetical protein n=1 Tax=Paeniglutamicibacter sp. ORCA_105 TaxID=3377336 RepID=UPI0038941DB2
MRWEALFADLEAEFGAEAAREQNSEIQELVRIERARQSLMQRLARHVGTRIDVQLLGAERIGGRLAGIGKDWLMLQHGGSEELIPVQAVAWWAALEAGRAPEPGERRVRFSQALRVLVRDRARVSVGGIDGQLLASGTLDQVGQDFLEVALHARDEFRRPGALLGRTVIPFAALARVRREG